MVSSKQQLYWNHLESNDPEIYKRIFRSKKLAFNAPQIGPVEEASRRFRDPIVFLSRTKLVCECVILLPSSRIILCLQNHREPTESPEQWNISVNAKISIHLPGVWLIGFFRNWVSCALSKGKGCCFHHWIQVELQIRPEAAQEINKRSIPV